MTRLFEKTRKIIFEVFAFDNGVGQNLRTNTFSLAYLRAYSLIYILYNAFIRIYFCILKSSTKLNCISCTKI